MRSPTQRTLAKLRAEGYTVEVTEHWNPFVRRRKDLFGFIDVLAVKGDEILAVQTTTASGSHVSARVAKICSLQSADAWLYGANRRIVVHGWAKRGPRGKRKIWTCSETEITAEQINPEPQIVSRIIEKLTV